MDDSTRPRRRMAAAKTTTTARAAASAAEPTTVTALTLSMLQSGATADLIETVLKHREREAADKREHAYRAAFLAFQSKGVEIIKTASYVNLEGEEIWYAPLAQLIETLSPALTAAGLSHRFIPNQLDNGDIAITCRLTHVDGHSEEATLSGPPNDSPDLTKAQAKVATSTLLQRATLKAVCGVAEKHDDLDGRRTATNGAAGASGAPEAEEPPRRERTESATKAAPAADLASGGERQNIQVRCRLNNRDLSALLDQALGADAELVDRTTLEGLTKDQYKLVRAVL